MAEILIKAIDAEVADVYKNAAGCYKKGDPVVVMEDGHEWGNGEGPPNFYILKLPGVSVNEIITGGKTLRQIALSPIRDVNGAILKRRMFNLDDALLPSKSIDEIKDTGTSEISTLDLQLAVSEKTADPAISDLVVK